jgi:hypothetical protein
MNFYLQSTLLALATLSSNTVVSAFHVATNHPVKIGTGGRVFSFSAASNGVKLFGKNNKSGSDDYSSSSLSPSHQGFPVGTFVEFEEKSREHVGKVTRLEYKSSGGARYHVVGSDGKSYDIPDKAILFTIAAPNSPGACDKLYTEFLSAHDASTETLQSKLEISSEILEIAWEETASSSTGLDDESVATSDHHMITPSGLISLVHSHTASAIEKYMAWKILRTDLAHIFFKEIKEKGRVVSFKAKARKAVEAAKQDFCNAHQDSDLCLV